MAHWLTIEALYFDRPKNRGTLVWSSRPLRFLHSLQTTSAFTRGASVWLWLFCGLLGDLLAHRDSPTHTCVQPCLECLHSHLVTYLHMFTHVFMIVWLVLGAYLSTLRGFRGQILSWHMYASRWPPRAHEFSPMYCKYVLYTYITCTLIEILVVGTIHMCYSILFCYSLAYFVK